MSQLRRLRRAAPAPFHFYSKLPYELVDVPLQLRQLERMVVTVAASPGQRKGEARWIRAQALAKPLRSSNLLLPLLRSSRDRLAHVMVVVHPEDEANLKMCLGKLSGVVLRSLEATLAQEDVEE